MLKVIVNTDKTAYDISEYIVNISHAGDKASVCRTCNIELVFPSFSEFLAINPKMAKTIVQVYFDSNEVFRGYIIDKDMDSSAQTIKLLCKDNLVFVQVNDTIGPIKRQDENTINQVFEGTPESICQSLCKSFNLEYKSFASTGINVSYIANCKTIQEVMASVYKEVGKRNGKFYYLESEFGKISMIEKNTVKCGVKLNQDCIQKITFAENIDNMINSCTVYDDQFNVVAFAENKNDITNYGLRNKKITANEEDDYQSLANNTLKSIEMQISLTVPGNIYLKTGRTVNVDFPKYGINSDLYIDSDTHNFTNGVYNTDLVLSYDIGGDE